MMTDFLGDVKGKVAENMLYFGAFTINRAFTVTKQLR